MKIVYWDMDDESFMLLCENRIIATIVPSKQKPSSWYFCDWRCYHGESLTGTAEEAIASAQSKFGPEFRFLSEKEMNLL